MMLGSRLVVVLNGSEAIREALINRAVAFAGRPDFYSFKAANKRGNSISLSDYSPRSRLLRKIAMGAIHKFVHKNGDVLDGKLRKECERLVTRLRANQRTPFDPRMTLRAATANVILGVLFGVDRDYENEELRQILDISDRFRETVGAGTAVDFMPWLSIFPNPQITKLCHLVELTTSLLGKMFHANRRNYNEGKIRNVADSFVKVIEEESLLMMGIDANNNNNNNNNNSDDDDNNNNNNVGSSNGDYEKSEKYSYNDSDSNNSSSSSSSSTNNNSNNNNGNNNIENPDDNQIPKPLRISNSDMAGALVDLFGAGFDTTSITLHWALAYMIKYPNIQRDVQKEIDDVIGRDRLPTLQDMGHLPLLEATINELLRVTSIAPLALPHSATTDTQIAGYNIPKGTVVFVNLWSLHRNQKYWDEPELFNPYRFLDSSGRALDLKSLPGFLPFGSGRRQCPGKSLALVELFTFLAVLLHQFRFSQNELAVKYQGINLQGCVGLTLSPETFYVHLEAR